MTIDTLIQITQSEIQYLKDDIRSNLNWIESSVQRIKDNIDTNVDFLNGLGEFQSAPREIDRSISLIKEKVNFLNRLTVLKSQKGDQ